MSELTRHTILKVIEILERALAVVQFMDCEIKDDTIKVMRCDRDSLDNLRYQLHELQQQIADSLSDDEVTRG